MGLLYFYSFMTTAIEGGEGSASRPGRSLLAGKSRYPLYRRVGGPQGRSGQENLVPTWIRPPDRPPRCAHYNQLNFSQKKKKNFPLTCDGLHKGIPLHFKQILSIPRCVSSGVTLMKKLTEPNILSFNTAK